LLTASELKSHIVKSHSVSLMHFADGLLSRRTGCARLWWQTVDHQPALFISGRPLPGEHYAFEQPEMFSFCQLNNAYDIVCIVW